MSFGFKEVLKSFPSCLAVWVVFITLKLGFICWLHSQTSWLLITSVDQIFKGFVWRVGIYEVTWNAPRRAVSPWQQNCREKLLCVGARGGRGCAGGGRVAGRCWWPGKRRVGALAPVQHAAQRECGRPERIPRHRLTVLLLPVELCEMSEGIRPVLELTSTSGSAALGFTALLQPGLPTTFSGENWDFFSPLQKVAAY